MMIETFRPVWRMWRAGVALVASMVVPAGASAQVIDFELQIHPELMADRCAHVPTAADLAKEDDFPKLLAKGWVALRRSDFEEHREFHPCLQEITVHFPSTEELHAFISEMSACPQYPFYSGADYALHTAIFEYAARSADATAYNRLLSKEGDCASEMNPPLYAILRKNPEAFLRAFASLSAEQQRVAAISQYDFNVRVEEQQFDISGLSPETGASARRFNELLVAASKKR